MSISNSTISKATMEDLSETLALLEAVNLPTEGVAEHLDGFLIARDDEGRLIGTIGLERHGDVGLLRSAAVAPGPQHSGIGTSLTAALLERARNEGVEEVLLLTSTAPDFFAGRFGFSETQRAGYEEKLANSPEWKLRRCSTAACMRLKLSAKKGSFYAGNNH